MDWHSLLKEEMAGAYRVAQGLIDMVEEKDLAWKPATGSNWMTTGQLLHHLSNACGSGVKGFVTGDWGWHAEGMPVEDMIPTAEKLPALTDTAEARRLLEEDHRLALEMLATVSEQDLASLAAPAPWDESQMSLGPRLLQMVQHLNQHKGQLFYYLKLQGKPVNTMHLWA